MNIDGQKLEIEYRNPADLVGYARNSKKHPPEQLRAIRRAMDTFGNYAPILLRDDGKTIGAGHGRRDSALLKPAMDSVPTIVLTGLSDEDWRALTIWDNRSGMMGSFDADILRLELGELSGAGFDLSLTGFSSLELNGIFSVVEGATDPDDTPEPPKVPVTQAGDLWLLGNGAEGHRLLCGDSTSKEDVDKLLGGQKPHLLVSDQPFGVEYSPSWRTTEIPQVGKWKSPNRSQAAVQNDDRADWREAWALFPGDVIYVWHSGRHASIAQASLEACGFEIRSQIIWRKTSFAVGRGHYHWQHESAWYAVRKGGNGHWAGDRKQTTVWDIDAPKRSDTGHGTQKPVECMARAVRNNSAPGDAVYEPFSGAFTTGIACHMNKRICVAMEIEPQWCDAGVIRWEAFTGLRATLAETGETFAEVKARRALIEDVV